MTKFPRWFVAAAGLAVAAGLADAQTPYLISTYAGGLPLPTAVTATSYPVGNPNAVATDYLGNVYASTSLNCVFRLDPSGYWSLVAGNCKTGFSGDNGSAVAAQLNGPQGLALDGAGNLYIADQNNHRIRKVTPAGIITTVAGTGTPGYFGDTGPATSAQLNFPQGIAVDTAGDLYIADKNNHRIRRVAPDGTITTVAGTGTAGTTGDGGPATSAQLLNPLAVALDSTGNLYVADKSSQVRKVDVSGNITHIAGTGTGGYSGDSGPASTAALSGPSGLAADFAGNLYIADTGNLRVRKISTGGIISTYAGNGTFGSSGDSGLAIDAQLAGPVGVSVEYPNTLYIADLYQVREVDTSYIIHTVAGPGGTAFAGDGGPATLAQFSGNWGIVRDALGPAGNLYVADTQNYRVRQINAAGAISTYAGTGTCCYSGDGGAAIGAEIAPYPLAVDSAGNIYLGESARVREVIASTGKIATVAGIGAAGWTGDGGLATSAKLALFIRGLAVDPSGNLYIADTSNNIVRKVTAGKISTVAGTGLPGYSGDGDSGTSAQLRSPAGLAVDTAGNLYIADFGNCVVRQLSIGGTISTVAGNGACGSTGDGEPATSAALNSPWGLAVDSAGNLYIATTGNTIREVSGGKIATIAGTGAAGYSGDGGLATSAQLSVPAAISLDASGNVYVSDFGNNAVRILQPKGTAPLLAILSTHTGSFTLGQVDAAYTIKVTNAASAASTTGVVTVTENIPSGLTLLSMTDETGTWACAGNVCTTSATVAGGGSFPPIAVTVSVLSNAPPQVTNLVAVSGGGSPGAGAADPTYLDSPTALLVVSARHTGSFARGQTNASYTVTVGNQVPAVPSSGVVKVTETLPTGLSPVSMVGAGWNCPGDGTCSRSDALAGGALYSPITVTVNVAADAPPSVTYLVGAMIGGSPNGSASDLTNILSTTTCDVSGGTSPGIADVQRMINEALGTILPNQDLNGDGVVNVVDVQIVMNAALGLGCTVSN
jgi:uncharacterized repeat protein (TIGR01451 family)